MKQYKLVEENYSEINETINCADNLSNDIESNDLIIIDKTMLMRLYDNVKSADTRQIVRNFRSKFHDSSMSIKEYTEIIYEEYEWLTFKDKISELKKIDSETISCEDVDVVEKPKKKTKERMDKI